MPESTHRLCAVCSDPVEPDIAHWLHETNCARSHGTVDTDHTCGCDAVAHPDCCPELGCQDIGNGYEVELAARFSVPPWFTADQVTVLAEYIRQHVTGTEERLYEAVGADSDNEYYDDSAYVCAVVAQVQVNAASGVAPGAILWGHGDRCKACHHIADDHSLDGTEGCAMEGCKCPRWVPYGRLADIRGVRS